MFEERVVHLPEVTLRCRGFRSFGRVLRVRVETRYREMSEDEAQPVDQPLLNILDDRMRAAAVRTFDSLRTRPV